MIIFRKKTKTLLFFKFFLSSRISRRIFELFANTLCCSGIRTYYFQIVAFSCKHNFVIFFFDIILFIKFHTYFLQNAEKTGNENSALLSFSTTRLHEDHDSRVEFYFLIIFRKKRNIKKNISAVQNFSSYFLNFLPVRCGVQAFAQPIYPPSVFSILNSSGEILNSAAILAAAAVLLPIAERAFPVAVALALIFDARFRGQLGLQKFRRLGQQGLEIDLVKPPSNLLSVVADVDVRSTDRCSLGGGQIVALGCVEFASCQDR